MPTAYRNMLSSRLMKLFLYNLCYQVVSISTLQITSSK